MKSSRRDFLKASVAGASLAALGTPLAARRAWAQAKASGPLKLGFISSLSGAQAPLGQPMLAGAQIAVDQINKAGGVGGRPLELVVRDDMAKPADATVAARELAGSGVNMLFGVVSSSVALALTAMLQQEKAILITCAAHSDKLTKENFNRNYFRVTDNPYMRGRAMTKALAERYPKVTQWSGLIPDHEYGRTTWACFKEGLNEFYPSVAKVKPSIVEAIKTQYGAPDYRSSITAAMAQPSEGWFVSVYGGDAVTLFQQAQPYGFYKKAKVIADSANEFIVAKAMKQNFPEMWIGAHWYAGAFESVPMSQELYKEYVARTNDRYPTGFVAEAHAAVYAYAAAVQRAGSNETDAVVGALEGMTWDTASGPRTFRKEDHQAIKPVVFYRVRGSASSSDGFEVVEFATVPGEEVIDEPTPGKPLKFRFS
jgi:branched-chain amino acid transport system substrate-binding protein